MMKITQERLAEFCSIVQALVPECKMVITETGWNTMAVDTANVGMVVCHMPNTSFTEFTVEKIEVGMDMQKWKDLLNIMKDPKGTITIDPITSGKLLISDGKYTYTHTPLDPTTIRKWPTMPSVKLPSSIDIDAQEFAESIKALAVIGDKVRFTAKGEVLEMKTEGDTDSLVKELNVPIPGDSRTETYSSLFSIEYLKDVSKAMKGAGKITVHMGKDHPIRFDFDLEGMDCSYLLAPRIEDPPSVEQEKARERGARTEDAA